MRTYTARRLDLIARLREMQAALANQSQPYPWRVGYAEVLVDALLADLEETTPGEEAAA